MEGRVADASQGEIGRGSKRQHFKRKRLKKELFSWLQRGARRHQVKRKRLKNERASRVQRGTDASEGEMSRSSKRSQVKCKSVKDDCASIMREGSEPACRFCNCRCKVYGGIDSSKGKKTVPFSSTMDRVDKINGFLKLGYARLALEFYEKRQGVEFEFEEALYFEFKVLNVDGAPLQNLKTWCHLSFTAKPKNADYRDVSPTHFFAELSKDKKTKRGFEVEYCTTFEPRGDFGFEHGCIICPADKKFHPGVDGYTAGRPPYYAVKILYR